MKCNKNRLLWGSLPYKFERYNIDPFFYFPPSYEFRIQKISYERFARGIFIKSE